jgi:hypothetical protein
MIMILSYPVVTVLVKAGDWVNGQEFLFSLQDLLSRESFLSEMLPGSHINKWVYVEVVLRYFHRHCYKGSPAVVLCWRGLKSLGLAIDEHGEH